MIPAVSSVKQREPGYSEHPEPKLPAGTECCTVTNFGTTGNWYTLAPGFWVEGVHAATNSVTVVAALNSAFRYTTTEYQYTWYRHKYTGIMILFPHRHNLVHGHRAAYQVPGTYLLLRTPGLCYEILNTWYPSICPRPGTIAVTD